MRTSWQVTRSVWYALFMREMQMRATKQRFGLVWVFVEPIMWVVVWIGIRTYALGRFHFITGADYVPWLIIGMMGFFMFRQGVQEAMTALRANKALFSYRQVLPVDTVFVRCAIVGLLRTISLVIIGVGAWLLGYNMLPAYPLQVVFGWISMWLLGVGLGLCLSIAVALVEELSMLVRMLMMPMFITSGAIIPLTAFPREMVHYLLYAPYVHGIAYLRIAFFEGYHTVDFSLVYMWYWILGLLALGLVLHILLDDQLKTR